MKFTTSASKLKFKEKKLVAMTLKFVTEFIQIAYRILRSLAI